MTGGPSAGIGVDAPAVVDAPAAASGVVAEAPAKPARTSSRAVDPTLDLERELLASGVDVVIGCDEVGRGSIAGPVAVGVCAVRAAELDRGFPAGLRDSKLLTEKRRVAVRPLVEEWAHATAVGYASAEEIDREGIVRCLALAARRALVQLHEAGVPIARSAILLDGSHDWLSSALTHPPRVLVRPKADRDCASVAGASVVAKVSRDDLMAAAAEAHPDYAWQSNRGYGSAAHYAAIERLGPTELHRHTWLRPRA